MTYYPERVIKLVDQLFKHYKSQAKYNSFPVSKNYTKELLDKIQDSKKRVQKNVNVLYNTAPLLSFFDDAVSYHICSLGTTDSIHDVERRKTTTVLKERASDCFDLINRANNAVTMNKSGKNSVSETDDSASAKMVQDRWNAIYRYLDEHMCDEYDGEEIFFSHEYGHPPHFEINDLGMVFYVLTREEADAAAKEMLVEDFDDFHHNFLKDIKEIVENAHGMRNRFVKVDRAAWAEWVLSVDGCGATLAGYDGDECRIQVDADSPEFFIYKN